MQIRLWFVNSYNKETGSYPELPPPQEGGSKLIVESGLSGGADKGTAGGAQEAGRGATPKGPAPPPPGKDAGAGSKAKGGGGPEPPAPTSGSTEVLTFFDGEPFSARQCVDGGAGGGHFKVHSFSFSV